MSRLGALRHLFWVVLVTLLIWVYADMEHTDTQTVTITASAHGFLTQTGTLDVVDHEFLTVDILADSISEHLGSTTATVIRSNTDDLSDPLTVALTTSDTSAATVPATVTIAANASSSVIKPGWLSGYLP